MGMVEALETRQLFAGPAVVAIRITGTEQEVTGVQLTFSDALDPVTAQNPDAYALNRKKVTADHGFDPLGLTDRPREIDKVRIREAVYDDASRTVTIVPAVSFNLYERLRKVRVSGKGDDAVRDVAGVPLDGDRDGTPGDTAILRLRLARSQRITFREVDGDQVKLKLVGPGKIWGVIPARRDLAPIFFLNRTNALKSGLQGWVVPNGKTGDGLGLIRQLSGTTFASTPILETPSIRVEIVDP
jgi:hypothetical protein